MNIRSLIGEVLAATDLHPILFDIGASGESHAIWDPICEHAIFVGFDPDERELQEVANGKFFRNVIINKAVTDEYDVETVKFYLTQSPFCSSMLPPNHAILSEYLFADLFTVKHETSVPATTLTAALEAVQLSHIDWLKLDTQGIDLRLLKSLNEALFSQLLAVDIEPGLTEFYLGESQFTDLHPYLLSQGFWLSDMVVKGSVKMRKQSLESYEPSISEQDALQRRMKSAPGWVEARYLRNLDHITTPEQHILLWVFALLDHQIGFAVDVTFQYGELFGKNHHYIQMLDTIRSMQQALPKQQMMDKIRSLLPVSFKKRVKSILR